MYYGIFKSENTRLFIGYTAKTVKNTAKSNQSNFVECEIPDKKAPDRIIQSSVVYSWELIEIRTFEKFTPCMKLWEAEILQVGKLSLGEEK